MKHAAVGPIAIHLPERIETNDDLQREFPKWDLPLIESKTGIRQRHIAGPEECSSDLGVLAAKKLLEEHKVDPKSIDFLLFCTQTPDYPLPTTACLIQDRLGLGTHCRALDFNLGCSGYVYGLSLADGLIRTGSVKRILFITAETYSKFIHPTDRSMRPIFGDAAAATIINAATDQSMWGFQYGTDGSGADTLMVGCGGFRDEAHALQPRHRKRWPSEIYMDGPSLINFTVGKIPELVEGILNQASISVDQIKYFLFHQATFKMLDQLQQVLQVDEQRMPIQLRDVGNTVSCTLPILIQQMREAKSLGRHDKNLLVGFGVGWSWAGCVWQDLYQPKT